MLLEKFKRDLKGKGDVMRCQHHSKACNECDKYSVNCDDCKHMDAEGDCNNEDSRYYCKFVDGLAVCCALYEELNK